MKSRSLSIRVPTVTHREIIAVCDATTVDPAALLREAISRVLTEYKQHGFIRFGGRTGPLMGRRAKKRSSLLNPTVPSDAKASAAETASA